MAETAPAHQSKFLFTFILYLYLFLHLYLCLYSYLHMYTHTLSFVHIYNIPYARTCKQTAQVWFQDIWIFIIKQSFLSIELVLRHVPKHFGHSWVDRGLHPPWQPAWDRLSWIRLVVLPRCAQIFEGIPSSRNRRGQRILRCYCPHLSPEWSCCIVWA